MKYLQPVNEYTQQPENNKYMLYHMCICDFNNIPPSSKFCRIEYTCNKMDGYH